MFINAPTHTRVGQRIKKIVPYDALRSLRALRSVRLPQTGNSRANGRSCMLPRIYHEAEVGTEWFSVSKSLTLRGEENGEIRTPKSINPDEQLQLE